MDIPRTIRLRLDQIDLPRPARPWCVGLRHLPQTIPTVRPEALPHLLLLQPLVVREEPQRSDSDPRRYKLLAGRRTLQLLLEQHPREHRVWALCVQKETPLPEGDDLEVLDTLLAKLICRPDTDDLTLIATALKIDKELRDTAGRYVDVETDASIGRLVGMSRTAMHRGAARVRPIIHEALNPETPIALDLLTDTTTSPTKQGADE